MGRGGEKKKMGNTPSVVEQEETLIKRVCSTIKKWGLAFYSGHLLWVSNLRDYFFTFCYCNNELVLLISNGLFCILIKLLIY